GLGSHQQRQRIMHRAGCLSCCVPADQNAIASELAVELLWNNQHGPAGAEYDLLGEVQWAPLSRSLAFILPQDHEIGAPGQLADMLRHVRLERTPSAWVGP